jgi:predicted alpha/beta hydrolase family esterase
MSKEENTSFRKAERRSRDRPLSRGQCLITSASMKAHEADILIVPGLGNSDLDHWQSRWESRLSTARRVDQSDWNQPDPTTWLERMAEAVNAATRPVILVAHSLGVATAIGAIPRYRGKVVGAFLVAPPDLTNPALEPASLRSFGPYTTDPLPFPSITVGSRNDPYSSFEAVEEVAASWGSLFIDAGEAGHINTDAGYGPWPEGSMTFAHFVARLKG